MMMNDDDDEKDILPAILKNDACKMQQAYL